MRKIFSSPQFKKRLIKFLKRNSDLEQKVGSVFKILAKDPKHPTLQTHRLHGKLSQFFACTINYKYRLIFSYDSNFIYPHTIGSHDDVY